MPEVPPPVLPKLEPLSEEEQLSTAEQQTQETLGIPRERVVAAMAKMIGFLAAIGLPREVFTQEAREFSYLAEETGFAESLCILIEYYFPDISEYSPWIGVIISGSVFAAAVWSKRSEILEKYRKSQTPPIQKVINRQKEKIKNTEKIENIEKVEVMENE